LHPSLVGNKDAVLRENVAENIGIGNVLLFNGLVNIQNIHGTLVLIILIVSHFGGVSTKIQELFLKIAMVQ
jgi:hypothetical protein